MTEDAGSKEHSGKMSIRDYPMIWVIFEIVLAAGLAALIIWWTLPKKDERKEKND